MCARYIRIITYLFIPAHVKDVYLSYLYDPLIIGLSTKIICKSKSKSKNILDEKEYQIFIKKLNDSLEYNYNFIHNFLLYDDLVKESIIYKIMAKL